LLSTPNDKREERGGKRLDAVANPHNNGKSNEGQEKVQKHERNRRVGNEDKAYFLDKREQRLVSKVDKEAKRDERSN
jgi:hypothetical protein